MAEKENIALLQRYYDEIFNKRNLAVADEVFAPEYVSHHNDPVGLPPGPEGVRQFVTATVEGFPDITITVEDIFAEGRVLKRGKEIIYSDVRVTNGGDKLLAQGTVVYRIVEREER